MNGWR